MTAPAAAIASARRVTRLADRFTAVFAWFALPVSALLLTMHHHTMVFVVAFAMRVTDEVTIHLRKRQRAVEARLLVPSVDVTYTAQEQPERLTIHYRRTSVRTAITWIVTLLGMGLIAANAGDGTDRTIAWIACGLTAVLATSGIVDRVRPRRDVATLGSAGLTFGQGKVIIPWRRIANAGVAVVEDTIDIQWHLTDLDPVPGLADRHHEHADPPVWLAGRSIRMRADDLAESAEDIIRVSWMYIYHDEIRSGQ